MSSIKTPTPVNTIAAVIQAPFFLIKIPLQSIVFTINQEIIYVISSSKLKSRSSGSVVQCSFVILCNLSHIDLLVLVLFLWNKNSNSNDKNNNSNRKKEKDKK